MSLADGTPLAQATADGTLVDDLVLGYRFGVFFFTGGVVPNTLDIRFQKVSGLSAKVNVVDQAEGGQNLHPHRLPTSIEHDNLVLERGLVVGSPLTLEFNTVMSGFSFAPSNVMVTLFGGDRMPQAAWLFHKAVPVRWSVSDLDASAASVAIETLELSHTRVQSLRV